MTTFIIIIVAVVFIIWLTTKKNKIENEENIRQISGELRVKYPNFVKSIRVVFKDKAQLYSDDNRVLCYKVPVMTFNRHMGDLYYSLIDKSIKSNTPYIIQGYTGLDRIEIIAEKYYLNSDLDLEIDEYLEILNKQATEIITDSRYLKSITY